MQSMCLIMSWIMYLLQCTLCLANNSSTAETSSCVNANNEGCDTCFACWASPHFVMLGMKTQKIGATPFKINCRIARTCLHEVILKAVLYL